MQIILFLHLSFSFLFFFGTFFFTYLVALQQTSSCKGGFSRSKDIAQKWSNVCDENVKIFQKSMCNL